MISYIAKLLISQLSNQMEIAGLCKVSESLSF